MNSWYILTVLKLIIWMLWPITVSAALATGTTDPFVGITGMHILVLSVISTLSGLTALTIRIDSELSKCKDEPLPRPKLFVASHMLGSWLAGVLAVVMSENNILSVWTEITLVIVASFMGAKFIEKVSEFYIGKITKDKDNT